MHMAQKGSTPRSSGPNDSCVSGPTAYSVAGLKTPEDYVRVGKAFKGAWNCAAIFEATATPWLTPAELHDMGFSQIAYPNILIGRVVKAIEHGLHRLAQLAAGEDNAFKNERAGNGTKEPGRRPRLAEVERAWKRNIREPSHDAAADRWRAEPC
jgi:hypothetical protein